MASAVADIEHVETELNGLPHNNTPFFNKANGLRQLHTVYKKTILIHFKLEKRGRKFFFVDKTKTMQKVCFDCCSPNLVCQVSLIIHWYAFKREIESRFGIGHLISSIIEWKIHLLQQHFFMTNTNFSTIKISNYVCRYVSLFVATKFHKEYGWAKAPYSFALDIDNVHK